MAKKAYEDTPLPIGYGQTISQPYVVAFMTEIVCKEKPGRVLEIGTGSGYQAAVLAEICDTVYTIEIVEELGHRAKEILDSLDYKNVFVRIGNGYQGWKTHAPFDAIIVTCAPRQIPETLKEQLSEGGRMIIPVGGSYSQQLYLIRKNHGKILEESVLPVMFVPMTGEPGNPEE
jgi:protein-L-isoaspartate(D-aspartate) O-methyltransferase